MNANDCPNNPFLTCSICQEGRRQCGKNNRPHYQPVSREISWEGGGDRRTKGERWGRWEGRRGGREEGSIRTCGRGKGLRGEVREGGEGRGKEGQEGGRGGEGKGRAGGKGGRASDHQKQVVAGYG